MKQNETKLNNLNNLNINVHQLSSTWRSTTNDYWSHVNRSSWSRAAACCVVVGNMATELSETILSARNVSKQKGLLGALAQILCSKVGISWDVLRQFDPEKLLKIVVLRLGLQCSAWAKMEPAAKNASNLQVFKHFKWTYNSDSFVNNADQCWLWLFCHKIWGFQLQRFDCERSSQLSCHEFSIL